MSQSQVNGLSRLLAGIESDPYVKDIRWAAYMLATSKHETADTYQPIHEYGGKNYFIRRYGGNTRKGRELGNDTPEEGYYYAGKGDVQLTGETNYEKAEDDLRREYPELVARFEKRTSRKFDLTVGDQPNDTLDPQNALDPEISYAIMSYGMRHGRFTGKSLETYKNTKSYVPWRRIINGLDQATKIAGHAEKFEDILRSSYIDDKSPEWEEGKRPEAAPQAIESIEETPAAPGLPEQIVTPPTAAIPVQTVAPVQNESIIDSTLQVWGARFVAVPAIVLGWIGAFFAWLKDSPWNVIIILVAASGGIAIVYIVSRHIYITLKESREAKALEAEKQRNHEIQMALIASAAEKGKNTVALVAAPRAEVGTPTGEGNTNGST